MAAANRHTSKVARQLGFASGLEADTSKQLTDLSRWFSYEG